MKSIKIISLTIIFISFFSCKKNKNLDEEKCFCIEYKHQECLKYYQTVEQDPWGSWLQSDVEIEKKVEHFLDSLNVQTFKIIIKDTQIRSGLIFDCTCSKTGKIICVKVNENDVAILKQHKFLDN